MTETPSREEMNRMRVELRKTGVLPSSVVFGLLDTIDLLRSQIRRAALDGCVVDATDNWFGPK